jgi:2-methylisocitrate lyase-like PEP mutase family enzyme
MPARPDQATAFNDLHRGPDILLLPNAWDAGSARLIESLGAKAIATTSAGVAWAHGWPDGDVLSRETLLASLAEITRAVSAPISADIEGGFSDDPAAVGDLVAAVIDTGVAGVNLEDGGGTPEALCAKISAARAAAGRAGVDLYINARTDVYLRGLAKGEAALAETVRRGALYAEAGASGLFAPGAAEPGEISALAAQIALPLNLLAWPGLPDGAALTALGVRRLSAGSGICQSLYGQTRRLTQGFLADGASGPMQEGAMPYPEINALFPAG